LPKRISDEREIGSPGPAALFGTSGVLYLARGLMDLGSLMYYGPRRCSTTPL